jgi:hypothetical protein
MPKLTLAPADDGAFGLNWYPAIGTMLLPTVMNWFDEPASNVNPVGVEDLGDGKTPVLRLRNKKLWRTSYRNAHQTPDRALAADHRDAEGDGSPSVSALIGMFDGFAFGFGPGRPNSGHRKAAICKRNCPIN